MQIVSLNGRWMLAKANDSDYVCPAPVPGVVHQALLAAELIEDPFYRDQELDQFWVGETDWLYEREFSVDATLLAHEMVLLRCHGLDTLATLAINGTKIARTDNMFRTYEFNVKEFLQVGTNTITVLIQSPINYLIAQESEHGILPTWSVGDHRINGGNYLRKEPSNFGWDWGPKLATSGIWRDIELVAFDKARVNDVYITQDHTTPEQVKINVQASLERLANDPLQLRVQLCYAGETVAEEMVTITEETYAVDLTIDKPQLWWISGLGEQPLYDLSVSLETEDGTTIDTQTKRIGLRTLELVREADEWGESFKFAVNGVPFFTKGANWIPADVFPSRLTYDDHKMLIEATVQANMNMLRVWGGGIYESDTFYDLCDEYGVAVWQDFIFACGTYPTDNADFMANVRAEAEDNVRRIRHHASLALWCGNNEIEQGLVAADWTDFTMSWEDYSKLFDDLLPAVVQELDPTTDYWPGSPHSPHGDRNFWGNQTCGDTHLWDVWHKRAPYEWYRTRQDRFVSEFGFQSFPEPSTIYEFTTPEDRNITSYVMEHHQRSGIGNSTIIHYMLDWFRLPTTFESGIWLSHILQGIAIKYAVEHWRRNMPRTMGTLYWQLNDLWPGPSWSSLDWKGNWKALHYMAKAFYAPVLLSALEDSDEHTIEVHVTNDKLTPFNGTAHWFGVTLAGATVAEGNFAVQVDANSTATITTLKLADVVSEHGSRNILVYFELMGEDGALISENLVHFERPKHFNLPQPNIQATLETNTAGVTELVLESAVPALWVWIESESEMTLSDNFVHLRPNQARRLALYSDHAIQLADLKISSLRDTF